MTLRHMKIFRSICENGYNTTKAATDMHMTQPAVSLAIKELEQYYGVVLFDRIGRRLRITEAGQKFLDYAIHISSLFDDMEKGMRDWDSFGIIRVGASITIGSRFLPYYVKAFNKKYPGTDIRVFIATANQLEEKINSNELDFALVESTVHSANMISEKYMDDYLAVIFPANSKYTQGQTISIEEFKQQKFLLREKGSGTRNTFDIATEKAGFSVTPIWESISTTALVNGVTNGIGISVLPHKMVDNLIDRGLLVCVNVEGIDFKRSFKIMHHKDKFLTSSAKAFIDLCRNYKFDDCDCPYNSLL